MGALFSKIDLFQKSKPKPSAITTCSWEKRLNDEVSPVDFLIENLIDGNRCREPGSVNGQQFIIQNCNNSKIFLLDFTNSVIVDECTNCIIVLGPVQRSAFFRNCKNCQIIVACEQFRLRDCCSLRISLYCATKPTIESSKEITFTCFQLYYDKIQCHFDKCNLNIWNNFWYRIHDYTPGNKNEYPNWHLGNVDLSSIKMPSEIQHLNISLKKNDSHVPVTRGVINNCGDIEENCLVVFCDQFSAKSFLKMLLDRNMNIILIRSGQVEMKARHAETLFFTSTFVNAIQHSPIIGLHMCGKRAIHTCTQIIPGTTETSLYYVSPTTNMASHQVNTFFSIADLHTDHTS